MGGPLRSDFTLAGGYAARPFLRKNATVSSQELQKSATVSSQKRDRFFVDNFITHRKKAGFIHKKDRTAQVTIGGSVRDRFSVVSLWALRAEATGKELARSYLLRPLLPDKSSAPLPADPERPL